MKATQTHLPDKQPERGSFFFFFFVPSFLFGSKVKQETGATEILLASVFGSLNIRLSCSFRSTWAVSHVGRESRSPSLGSIFDFGFIIQQQQQHRCPSACWDNGRYLIRSWFFFVFFLKEAQPVWVMAALSSEEIRPGSCCGVFPPSNLTVMLSKVS